MAHHINVAAATTAAAPAHHTNVLRFYLSFHVVTFGVDLKLLSWYRRGGGRGRRGGTLLLKLGPPEVRGRLNKTHGGTVQASYPLSVRLTFKARGRGGDIHKGERTRMAEVNK